LQPSALADHLTSEKKERSGTVPARNNFA